MKVNVTLDSGETVEVELEKGTGMELLEKLGLPQSTTIIMVDGRVVPEDDVIEGRDVRVLIAVSRG